MTEPRTHPAGVVIPPDPGDPNHDVDSLGGWMGGNAPQKPQAPTSGPDRGSRAETDAETAGRRTEALMARALVAICDEAPCWLEELGGVEAAVVSVSDAANVVAHLLTAYGDEREKAGAENALREAVAFIRERLDNEASDEERAWNRCGAWLELRADEIGGRA